MLDGKNSENELLIGEKKKLQLDLEKADQINNDLRGKTLDKELEAESLQVG